MTRCSSHARPPARAWVDAPVRDLGDSPWRCRSPAAANAARSVPPLPTYYRMLMDVGINVILAVASTSSTASPASSRSATPASWRSARYVAAYSRSRRTDLACARR